MKGAIYTMSQLSDLENKKITPAQFAADVAKDLEGFISNNPLGAAIKTWALDALHALVSIKLGGTWADLIVAEVERLLSIPTTA